MNVAVNPCLRCRRRTSPGEAGIAVRRRHCRSELPGVRHRSEHPWRRREMAHPHRNRPGHVRADAPAARTSHARAARARAPSALPSDQWRAAASTFTTVQPPVKPLAMGLGPVAAPWLDIAKTLEQTLRRVTLLAVDLAVPLQPGVDDPGEGVQLRSLDRRLAPKAGWNRERQHLADAVARNVELSRRLSLAQALGTSQTKLPISTVMILPPSLKPAGKDMGGRLLRRPQRARPAPTLADFLTAVLTPKQSIAC